jgi:hypothetical protein
MLSNPLKRVIFRNKTLDGFRFTIWPENIDLPARTGIFPRHESWSLLGHPPNMRLWRPGSSQLSCHNQLTHYPGLVLCPLGQALGQSEARDRSPLPPHDSGKAAAGSGRRLWENCF